jgi:hypothetical protein
VLACWGREDEAEKVRAGGLFGAGLLKAGGGPLGQRVTGGRADRVDGPSPFAVLRRFDVQVGGLPAAVRKAAELAAVGALALVEQQVIRLALDPLAWLETESVRGRAHHLPGGSPPLSLAWM